MSDIRISIRRRVMLLRSAVSIYHFLLISTGVLWLLDSSAVRRRSRAARGARVVVSDVIGAVYVPFVCVVRACAVRVVGSVSCHVDATFSRRAARVGANVKGDEGCVCSF